MADQYNDTSGKVAGVIDEDDPLAELARIIGYDRPAPSRPEETGAQVLAPAESAEIDLEAELLRELEPAYAETESREQPAAVTPPPFPDERASEAASFPFEQDEQDFEEAVSADPIAGLPDEPPFDPFSAQDEHPQPSAEVDEYLAQENWLASDNAEPAPAPESEIDLAEIDLPEDELYQALEDELTISEDDLVDEGSDGLAAAPVVPDFGDEELPAEETGPAPAAYEPASADFDETETVAYDEAETVAFAGPADEPEASEGDDFANVLAEWDAMVEGDEPAAETTAAYEEIPQDVATDDQQVAEIPSFLGTTPDDDSGDVLSGGNDDDILADMSRFELPVFGATVSVADHAASQDQAPVEAEDVPSLMLPGEFEVEAEAETALENDLTDFDDFDDFEDELSADLDAFSKQLETGEMVIEPVPAPVDEFPEIEADFDDAAEDFLADTDFDLVVEDFNPMDNPAESIEETFVSEAETETAPESEAAVAAPDGMEAVYSDFAQEDDEAVSADDGAPELDWMSGDENSVDEDDAAALEGAADAPLDATPQEEEPFDAFFPQQPVIAVPPVPLASAAEPVEPAMPQEVAAEEGESDDWLASLEAEMEEDVAEQEAELAAISSTKPGLPETEMAATEFADTELPEPDLSYGPADDTADIAFDQSAIADVEEAPGSVGDLEIPDMPVDEASEDDFDTVFESELDREFADLVEAEGHEDIASASPTAWYSSQNEAPAAEETYSDFESDLGFSGPADGGYRPHPQPVDADAPVASDGQANADDDRRKPLIAGIILGVALLLGGVAFGWNWIFGGSTGDDGPRIIMADKDPVKVVPENPGGAKVPNQDKAVYEKVEGNESGAASQPRLVDSAEEPVDVVQRTIDPDMLPLEGRDATETMDTSDTGKVEDRLTEGDTEAAAASGNADQVLSPRRVRTMIVRPDGTIVARPQEEVAAGAPAASATAEPAAGQDATALDTAIADPATAASEGGQAGTPAEQPAETAAAGQGEETADAEAPVRTVTTVPVTQTPVPTSRPAEQPVNVVGRVSGNGTVSEVASADPAAAAPAQTQAQAPANPGGYYIQVASQPSAEGAQASYQNLSRRYSSIIGGRGVDIQRAEIPDRGVYHRVRIPAGTREEANALCARYKSAGGSCIVTR
ncbi:MAG: hypothetical protein CML30_12770 [Rhizobiales bacterium]|nr:hypothetical protein [Hyphomicrobiales bacterium]